MTWFDFRNFPVDCRCHDSEYSRSTATVSSCLVSMSPLSAVHQLLALTFTHTHSLSLSRLPFPSRPTASNSRLARPNAAWPPCARFLVRSATSDRPFSFLAPHFALVRFWNLQWENRYILGYIMSRYSCYKKPRRRLVERQASKAGHFPPFSLRAISPRRPPLPVSRKHSPYSIACRPVLRRPCRPRPRRSCRARTSLPPPRSSSPFPARRFPSGNASWPQISWSRDHPVLAHRGSLRVSRYSRLR